MSSTLDTLKSIRYGDFLRFGRLPRSSDGLAQHYTSEGVIADGKIETSEVIIFFSYRWINKEPGALSPDDAENTQYKRMITAAEEYLRLHPGVNRERFSVWVVSHTPRLFCVSFAGLARFSTAFCFVWHRTQAILFQLSDLFSQDHACVDQDDPMPGVSALLMIIAQCNALISLIDDIYYQRAWCSVEVMMVQALKRSYHMHEWYEHVPAPEGVPEEALAEDALNANPRPPDTGHETDQSSISNAPESGRIEKSSTLRPGPMDMNIIMAENQLKYESDWPKVLFLERQSRLLS